MSTVLLRFRNLFSVLFILAIWESVARSGIVPARYFPGLPEIATGALDMIRSGELLAGEMLTLSRALIGLLLATFIGITLAILSDVLPFFDRGFRSIAGLLQPIPPAAIVPLAIFGFGLGINLYIFIVVIVTIWSPYLNGVAALRAVPVEQVLSGRMMRISGPEIMLRIKLPSAMPQIFAGIRYAAAVSLIAVVVSEMIAGRDGIGFMLIRKSFSIRIAETYALMFVTMMNGVFLAMLVNIARRIVTGWHVKQVSK